MADDSIKYRDLIEPDDSIERLIKQMEELTSVFGQATSSIKGGASEVSKSMKGMSGATAEGRKELDVAAVAAERLQKATQELAVAEHELGKQAAQVRAMTAERNKLSVEEERSLRALGTSYNAMKTRLNGYVAQFKQLTAEQRANSAETHELFKAISELNEQLRQADAQLKPYTKQMSVAAELAERLEKSTRELEKAEHGLNVRIQENKIKTQEANREAKLQARINATVEGSYDNLSAQYELNKIKLNAMSKEMRENTKEGQALVASTYRIYQEMIELQEATGRYSLSVGNYGKAWNGLNFAVQQTVRELPSLAIGFQTFFLGISNNLPYVIDEIHALSKASKSASSVIKGLLGSIFNWQTGLIVLITVLSACGDEIFDWAARLFGAKAKVMSLTEAIKNINKELESTNASYGDNVVKLKHLQNEWKNLKTTAEKTKWIKDNKSEFSSLYIEIDNINDAEKIFVTQTDEVVEGFKARAKAAAANKLAAEKYEEAMIEERKRLEKEREYEATLQNQVDTSAGYAAGGYAAQGAYALDEAAKTAQLRHEEEMQRSAERIAALEAEGDQYFRLAEGYDKARNQGRGGGRGRQKRDMTDYIAQMNINTLKKRETLRTALEQEEYQKRITAIEKRYAVENAELQKTYDKNERILKNEEGLYKDLTAEQVRVMLEAQERIRESLAENERLMLEEKRQALLDQLILEEKVLQESLKLKLDTIKKGSDAELEARRKILESQRQQALAADQKLPPSQRQGAGNINASFDVQDKRLQGEFFMSWFDMYQDMERAQFESVIRTGREIKVKALEQERDRWQAQVDLAKAGMLDWSEAQIEAAEATTEKLSREIKKQSNLFTKVAQDGLGTTLLNALGIKDEDAVQGFVDSVGVIIDQINAIMDAEIKAKEKAVELAQERVDAAQSAVDAEIEARKNGYANSVAVAKAELEMEKRNQRQKEKELRRAQQAQEAINSVTQASSLVTATANLLAGWSSIPIVGQALAIAAIGAMWGTFAMAKIRATQLTSKYGEGGLEFLEGGSHAMGNDIDLGVSNSKNRRMKAEGGEALAIINKRNSRKYRKVLPDVIDSFNRGTFEQKYLNAFDTGGQPIFVTNQSNNIDLSRIEADIRAIKDRNNTQIYTLPDGSVIMQKKNVKRIIRQ